MTLAMTRLPRCRFGCPVALVLVSVPAGCFCFPDDRKQWLCLQHLVSLGQPHTVIADVVS
jgi:hypothetical protein